MNAVLNSETAPTFMPLRDAPSDELAALLNDPRVTRHMPLAQEVDIAWVDTWKNQKSALWPNPDFGPWAVYLDNKLAGWVGLQPDGDGEVELAVVLNTWAWSNGLRIANRALVRWRQIDPASPINLYFPTSRPVDLIAERLGLEIIDRAEFAGHEFVKLRLLRDSL